jgi:hypothetical protein
VYCKHPNVGISLVDGEVKPSWALVQRAARPPQLVDSMDSTCGPDGDWYEEIDPPVGAPKGWWSFIWRRK